MLIENADYFIRIIDFPVPCIGGMVMPNDDGTFSIYLNGRLDDTRRRLSLLHELRHIEQEDFYSDKPIEQMEQI